MEVQTTASDHSNAVKHPGDTYTDKYENTSNRLCSKNKVFPYSLPSVGPGADPGVQAVRTDLVKMPNLIRLEPLY